jgi:hypothetical protein
LELGDDGAFLSKLKGHELGFSSRSEAKAVLGLRPTWRLVVPVDWRDNQRAQRP